MEMIYLIYSTYKMCRCEYVDTFSVEIPFVSREKNTNILNKALLSGSNHFTTWTWIMALKNGYVTQ